MRKRRKFGPCRELIATAAGSKVRVYGAIVLVCGFIFALGLCFVLRPRFEFKGNLDIASWITANKYPKQQELFYYTGALFFIPFLTAVVWGFWLLCSAAASRLFRLPLDRTLKKLSAVCAGSQEYRQSDLFQDASDSTDTGRDCQSLLSDSRSAKNQALEGQSIYSLYGFAGSTMECYRIRRVRRILCAHRI